MVHPTLIRHLESWIGGAPPVTGLEVVGSEMRTLPGWDGNIRPVAGVSNPSGTILSVPPRHVEAVRASGDTLDEVAKHIGVIVGMPEAVFYQGVFRWSEEPTPTDDPGIWIPAEDPRVPEWLKPFNGVVLASFEDDVLIAGVGRKQHDSYGHELAVVTEETHQRKGLAKRLVAQAARRVLADGAIPTYFHQASNLPSAATADAAGFPDRGWKIIGLFRT